MKSALSVKMLAALALVLLVFSATEGRILSKCELKAQLEAALRGNQGGSVPGNVTSGVGNGTGSVPGNGTGSVLGNGTAPGNATVDLGLIAKIVCSVERVSKFNTNLVTPIRGDFRPQERPGGRPGQGRPGGRGKRSPGGGRGRNPPSLFGGSSEEDSSERNKVAVATNLLGIFQLIDRVACNSGSGQSLNICRMNCSALIDDDIRDDITCLQTLLDSVNNATAPVFAPRSKKKKHFLCVKECLNVSPSQYFAECV